MTPATLLAWRERLGFNQSEAARRLGCSRNAYLNWETGRSRIPLYVALACAAIAYGLPPIP
jgi:transcriptional regulator with XRE-family HTH domain